MSNKLVLITILVAFLKISEVHLSEVDLALNGDEDEMEMDRRTGRIDQKLRWPKNEEGKVIVPVSLANRDDWGPRTLDVIRSAAKEIEAHTCVRFVERKDEEDYILIVLSDKKCLSSIGRTGGAQEMEMVSNGGCAKHSFLHALGLVDMIKNFDRDQFIRINYENLNGSEDEIAKSFGLNKGKSYNYYGTSYDFDSIMHLDTYAKSKGLFLKSVEAIDPANQAKIEKGPYIDPRKPLSKGDIQRINKMYECESQS